MIWPSGLKHGTSMKITLSRIRRASSSFRASRSKASSGAIWVPPISVACMLIDCTTIALPSPASARACASVRPRGSLNCAFTSRYRSSFAMFAADVMKTSRNGLPSDVGPMFTAFNRPPLSFSRTPKYSTILSQRAIFLSAPNWKPKNFSGVVMSCPSASAGRTTQKRKSRRVRISLLIENLSAPSPWRGCD